MIFRRILVALVLLALTWQICPPARAWAREVAGLGAESQSLQSDSREPQEASQIPSEVLTSASAEEPEFSSHEQLRRRLEDLLRSRGGSR